MKTDEQIREEAAQVVFAFEREVARFEVEIDKIANLSERVAWKMLVDDWCEEAHDIRKTLTSGKLPRGNVNDVIMANFIMNYMHRMWDEMDALAKLAEEQAERLAAL